MAKLIYLMSYFENQNTSGPRVYVNNLLYGSFYLFLLSY